MNILEKLHQDHVRMSALLNILENELKRMKKPDGEEEANVHLMRDIARYFVGFPDVTHHPTEDKLFSELSTGDSEMEDRVALLRDDHADLSELAQQFELLLIEVVSGGIVERDALTQATEAFLNGQREHMNKEEKTILPEAEKRLDERAIAGIEAAYDAANDPLFGSKVDEYYERLNSAILAQANT